MSRIFQIVLMLLLAGANTLCLAGCALSPRAPAATNASPDPTVPPVQSPTIIIPTTAPTTAPATAPDLPADTPQPGAEPSEESEPQPRATEPSPEAPTASLASPTAALPTVALSEQPKFASFNPVASQVEPAMIHEPIAADLSNVVVPFVLSPEQRNQLAETGLVMSPGVEKEFFTVYEIARYDNVPIFVTSDSLLHSYHLLFDKVLRTAERTRFIPLLNELNRAVLAETVAQYEALQGTNWEEAAARTVAFVATGGVLLDPAFPVPEAVGDLVAAELVLIENADGIHPSYIFPGLENGEDYTQYIPRGHYTISEDLSNYFRSMMWYGRMTFRLETIDPAVGLEETRSALLLVQALRQATVNGGPAMDAWLDLYNPTVFFVGRSDDLTAMQYLDVMDTVYGPDPDLTALIDEGSLDMFIALAGQLPPPRILGLVIQDTDDVKQATQGFRFMGQRFVPDAYIFRQLIYRNVSTSDDRRGLPNGLDIVAAMGSNRAYDILEELGETSYQNYPQQMVDVREWVDGLSQEEWTETLYTTWLYTLQTLLEEPGDNVPQFMASDAWLDKQLHSSLGSWAELKHDTILYAKQVYAELGGGGSGAPQPVVAQGYVEPVPDFFARLGALATMTRVGLVDRGLLDIQDEESLLRIEQLAEAFRVMAEKELRGEPLSASEYNLIRYYGGELEHLVMASADNDGDGGAPVMDEEPQAAVIADVATDPSPQDYDPPQPIVLEVGVGRINDLYVVVPAVDESGDITLQVAKGGAFSYYEFPWPANDRLTDELWREMLAEGDAPAQPEWTSTFIVPETEFAHHRDIIYDFQTSLSEAYWELGPDWIFRATDELKAEFGTIFEQLYAEGEFWGHQWVNTSYRSFDIQSEDMVVVTARETWDDKLYEFVGQPGSFGPPVAQRGPYTLDATYTLLLQDSVFGPQWRVSRVVYADEPPEWTPVE